MESDAAPSQTDPTPPASGAPRTFRDLLVRGAGWSEVLRQLLVHAFVFARFVLNRSGRECGVGRLRKLWIAARVIRINLGIKTLTSPAKQLWLVEEVLRVPGSVPGDVVECGCFNGASTASLSLACELSGRRLFVCDSFEGLPEPSEEEKVDVYASSDGFYVWEKGEFSSEGSLEGVRRNVERYGRVDVCHFVKGFFNETLPRMPAESIVLIFEDADLASSVRDCLEHLWPKLQTGCCFYSDEPWSVHVVGLFYDKSWWEGRLGSPAPGFVGSGCGLHGMQIGYARKVDVDEVMRKGGQIRHRGSMGFDPGSR